MLSRNAHCLPLAIFIAFAWSSVACLSAEQYFDDSLLNKFKWKEFEAKASEYITKGNKTTPWYFTELAMAQQKQKKYDAAEKTLREGIKKHPEDPLCYSSLAACLAYKGGDPRNRREAIRLYEITMKKVAPSHLNTFDYVPKIIMRLKQIPADRPFPVISPTVRAAVNDLISCGFFSNWSAKDVCQDLALSSGSCIESPLDAYMLEGIAVLDSSHFRNVAVQFYTEVVMETVGDLGKQNGYSSRYISEKMLGADGTREVAFEIDKQLIKAKIRTSRELLALVNKALGKSATCKKRFYFLSAEDPEEQLMGFLNTQQVACLKSKGLFKRAVLL